MTSYDMMNDPLQVPQYFQEDSDVLFPSELASDLARPAWVRNAALSLAVARNLESSAPSSALSNTSEILCVVVMLDLDFTGQDKRDLQEVCIRWYKVWYMQTETGLHGIIRPLTVHYALICCSANVRGCTSACAAVWCPF